MKKGMMIMLVCILFFGIFFALKSGRESDRELQTYGSSFLQNIRIMQKNKGAVVWTLTAERADFPEGEDKARLRAIRLEVPENKLVLCADSGTYVFSERSFSADTIIEARGDDYRITADSLDLDLSSSVIQTEGRVRLEGKGFSLEGEGMQAGKEQKVRIFRDVKAVFQ